MEYSTKNKYTVFFKDGTNLESSGSSSGIRKSKVSEEFSWVAFHIEKEVLAKGKSLDDIDRIEYSLTYVITNPTENEKLI